MTSPRRPRKTGQNRVDIRIKAGIARKVRPNCGPRAKRAGFQSRARRLVQRANPTSAAARPLHQAVEAMQPNGIARRPMTPQNGLYPPVAKPRQDPHAQRAARARESCACQRDQTPCRGGQNSAWRGVVLEGEDFLKPAANWKKIKKGWRLRCATLFLTYLKHLSWA